MGYTAAEAHVHADELGDTFSDDMVVRIEEKLGHPDRCPHGWPVDPRSSRPRTRSWLRSRISTRAVRPRSSGSPSTTGLLHWFYDEGFVPGAGRDPREA